MMPTLRSATSIFDVQRLDWCGCIATEQRQHSVKFVHDRQQEGPAASAGRFRVSLDEGLRKPKAALFPPRRGICES